MSEKSELLSPPQKDFRKFSLPLSMTSAEAFPASSLSSQTWWSFTKANGTKTPKKKDNRSKFQLSIDDEVASHSLSPIKDFIDEQCLHFEENFVKVDDFEANFFKGFNEKFNKLNDDFVFRSLTQASTETLVSNGLICRKCGHDILKL